MGDLYISFVGSEMNFVGSLLKLLEAQRSWSALFLRVAVGMTFVTHGYDKVFKSGIMETAQAFAQMGIPLGGVLGPLVPIAEFFGGLGLILGLGTRLWAFLQAWTMVFAIAFVHGGQGFALHAEMAERSGKQVPSLAGWEWQALLLASCITLFLTGAGVASVDHFIRRKFRV
jgi:putative oxidoreductase